MSDRDYTELDKVKRIIRSVDVDPSVQKKVKFSGSYSLPKKYSSNAGNGMLLGITVLTSYVGYEHWKIIFTSTTAFTLYRGEDELSTDGTGDTGSEFISDSKIITIPIAQWTGTHITGDSFKFNTESNISDEDARAFMSDAEDIANTTLEEFIGSTNVPFEEEIPAQINTATAYIAAYLIYSSVYSATNPSDLPEFVNRWYRIGSNLISSYMESIPGRLIRRAIQIGRFVAREPIFENVGLQGVAGVGLTDGDAKGEIDAQDIGYDEFHNTEEGGS